MRNGQWCIRLVAGLAVGLTMTVQAEEKTAYVHLARVFKNYYKTVKQEALLRKREDVYKERAQELAKEVEDVKKVRDQAHEQSLNIALSDDVRAKHREDALAADAQYREKQGELRNFFGQKQKELRDQYLEIRQGLVKEIVEQLNVMAERDGYDFILDVSGLTNNALPVVLRYPKDKEITDQLIAEINKGHESEVPAEDDADTEQE